MSDSILIASQPGKDRADWWAVADVTDWPSFVAWLRTPTNGLGKYGRPYVPVSLHSKKAGRRLNTNLEKRFILTLDGDHSGLDYLDALKKVWGGASVSHPTASSTEAEPRWRTCIPLSRGATPQEAKSIADHLVGLIGRERFDVQASTSPIQVAYAPEWPIRDEDWRVVDGEPLDVDTWLMVSPEMPWSANDAVTDQTVDEFLAAYPAQPGRPCKYGRDALANAVKDDFAQSGSGKVHASVYAVAARFVEMVKAGCWSAADHDELADAALRSRSEPRPGEWRDALASAIGKGTKAKTGCGTHTSASDVFDAVVVDDDAGPVFPTPEGGTKAVVKAGGIEFPLIRSEIHMPEMPMPNARAMQQWWPRVCRWQGEWYVYTGGVFRHVSEDTMKQAVYLTFEHATYRVFVAGAPPKEKAWNPSSAKVDTTLSAFGAVAMVPDDTQPDTSRLNLTNGLLDLRSRNLEKHTDALFSVVQMPYAYDAEAECPLWQEKLEQVFEDDPDQILLLQEMFGYVVSGQTNMQKIFYLVGPKRAFKGTTLRVLGALVGEVNVASPAVSLYAEHFGLQGLIGKTLAATGDARFSKGLDLQTVTERWLTISGEDSISVPRKHRDDWVGKLGARIVVASNDDPPFRDASAAVVSRLELVKFTKSFYKKEDTELAGKLMKELPGILNWALDGLDRLNERGRFTRPASSDRVLRGLEENASPVKTFADEFCMEDPDQKVLCSEFIEKFNWWLAEQELPAKTSTGVGLAIRSAYPKVERMQKGPRGQQKWYYVGLGWV